MKASQLSAIAGLAVMLGVSPSAAADLSSAKALYASASYEEALTTLASLETTESVEPLNELRALCLLALGRSRDAEQAVTLIVLHNPTYAVDIASVSPKLVALFSDVRRRLLPTAARSLYTRAKSSYDGKQWVEARRDFSRLMAVLNEPDMVGQQGLADLRQLGEGFLKLSEVEYAAAVARGEIPATVGDAETDAPPPPIYTNLDRGVTPPVEQRSVMPRPPSRGAGANAIGALEVVVDETGHVEQATMLKPTTPLYDSALVDAARSWRYVPAMKDGIPVRYRFVLQIVLRPGQ